MLLVKGVLKICSKFTGEHPCRSVISINLQSNFIEITLQHMCCPVNLLHIFRTPFLRTPLAGCFRAIFPSVLTLRNFCLYKKFQSVGFFLGDSDIIKLLFNTILKYIVEHAIEKLNTKLFYHRKLFYHIPLHFTDKN